MLLSSRMGEGSREVPAILQTVEPTTSTAAATAPTAAKKRGGAGQMRPPVAARQVHFANPESNSTNFSKGWGQNTSKLSKFKATNEDYEKLSKLTI